ncbi:endonuclease domain-containing 1 protein-like isoform X1 [Salmo salar]|uniref:Endonuclease domain-containing 1 protein-like isoform X1 n=2 Tax=Salmo salar TaxID=8030 RepID=A0ABM3EE29_SALSA|nr:endonuclease domain-containing 1 protein-like isoform X1 [Salmo salar]
MMGVLNHLSTLLLLSLLLPALSHVVEKFSDVKDCEKFFLEGTTPNLPGILVGGTVQDQNRYKPICQFYKDRYRFATLYDTTNRIPVFSAYTFTGKVVGRPSQSWMIEPQLEDINNQHDMKVDDKDFPHNQQAADTDYKNNNKHLDRGHLFPCLYAPDDAAKRSTFTLTNIVPQARSFNQGSWSRMECRVRDALELNCKDANDQIKAYVVTGAVPSNNNTLKNRVNIPDLMWTAYCCYNNNLKQWVAQAHWSKNVQDTNKKTLTPETWGSLEGELKNSYKVDGFQVFPKNCPRTVILSVLEDETGRNLEGVEEVEPGKRGAGKGAERGAEKGAIRWREHQGS